MTELISMPTESDSFNDYLTKVSESLPDLILEGSHLIKAGLAGSPATLVKWRRNGHGPPYFKRGNRYYYFKKEVLMWLRNSYKGVEKC